jgi:hypothetical protein
VLRYLNWGPTPGPTIKTVDEFLLGLERSVSVPISYSYKRRVRTFRRWPSGDLVEETSSDEYIPRRKGGQP